MSAADRLVHLAALVETSSDAILSKSLDGTITSWNRSAERMFGYTPAEIVGKNIRLLIPHELQAEEDEILRRLRAGLYVDHFETVRVTKDGRRLDVSLSISPVRDATGTVIGAAKIIRDVSERKRAEEELAAAIAKFESVFNQSGIFAGIMDIEGVLREINVLAVDGCGYTREEVLDRPFWETPWWRGSEQIQERIRHATRQASNGEVFRETLPYWVADGGEHVVDFALHPIRDAAGTVRFLHPTGIDITERRRAEEALRAREAAEREIALALQRALLPEALVEHPHLALSARYEARSDALEVGGDWYDTFLLPDGRIGLAVGDVVGHGLAAAAAMGQLRTALAALGRHAASPGELLALLDDFLAGSATTDFATVCYCVLDPAACVVEYASAGHPPPISVSPAGETHLLEGGRSAPLFGRSVRSRPQAAAMLEPGSLLVLYSDGLVERRGRRLDDGLAMLETAAGQLAGVAVEAVCDRLVAALGVETSREDDVAVLAVRLAPTTGRAFHRVFPARPEELRALRTSMRAWLGTRRVPEPVQLSILLAIGEACGNAIEHAYHGAPPGDVRVAVTEGDDSCLLVEVRDCGRFRDDDAATSADRGRGTRIMRNLTTDFSRHSTPAGTTVRFRVPVGESAPT